MLANAEQQVATLQQRFRLDIQTTLRNAVADSESGFLSLLRYHLGWEEADGTPVDADGGKALRPVLCLTACKLAGGDPRQALPAAAALELVHNFSLIHDDIQDRDRQRRGRDTLWTIHGESKAMAAGNEMRVIADRTLMRLLDSGVSPGLVVEVATDLTTRYLEMIEGQYLDMFFEHADDVTVGQYLDMIGRKTGALIESAMFMGALIATGEREKATALGRCGRALGLAFQIRDDYLGVWGDPAATGKAVGADIRRKKKSMPIVHMFQHAPSDERVWLRETYAAEAEVGGQDVERILNMLDHLGTPRYVQEAAKGQADGAMRAVEGLGLSGEATKTIRAMAEFFVTREK